VSSGCHSLCGSGFETVINAAEMIELGQGHIAIAAGTENMSAAPFTLDGNKARWGVALGQVHHSPPSSSSSSSLGRGLGSHTWDGGCAAGPRAEGLPVGGPDRLAGQHAHGHHRREPGSQVRHHQVRERTPPPMEVLRGRSNVRVWHPGLPQDAVR
jgi:hypothetical protein